MSREGRGKLAPCLSCRFLNPVFEIGFSAADFKQGLTGTSISGCFIPIERITGKAHDRSSLGGIAPFGGKVEKSGLVLDDALIKTFHRELRWHCARLMGLFTLPSKRSSPCFSRGYCPIKSKLVQIKSRCQKKDREAAFPFQT